uniref:Uncharacterized protein n=1 Tax=Fundulus heteroclitus TaxID=8078 RepID=A0A146SGI2_FUNHE
MIFFISLLMSITGVYVVKYCLWPYRVFICYEILVSGVALEPLEHATLTQHDCYNLATRLIYLQLWRLHPVVLLLESQQF